jgi:hypothetical protein
MKMTVKIFAGLFLKAENVFDILSLNEIVSYDTKPLKTGINAVIIT